jgi:DNA-binding LacI/PurR family transcriptional regulator
VTTAPRPRRPTLADVAARAGVSPALVSIVIRGVPGASEQTRERVLRAAEEIGYRPDQRARLLRQHRPRVLGVTFGVQHAFHGDLVEAIYAAAEQAGYTVVLSAVAPTRSEQRAIDTLVDERCEALILLGPQAPATSLVKLGLPVVVVARRLRDVPLSTVCTADDDGMRQAIDHLVGLGHRDIVHIDGGRAPSGPERRRGYRTAMRRHGLDDRIRVLPGGLAEDSGAAAARSLLADRRPTAVVAFNDRCATGVLDTFIRAGLSIPGDISLVGYDDSRLARLSHIDMTTVGQDAVAMGRHAVRRAIEELDGGPAGDREIVLAPHLVVRATTGPPRRG